VPLAAAGLTPGAEVSYDIRVEESREEKQIASPYLPYWLPGAVAYHGSGTVLEDPLRIAFKMPLQLRYGNTGRVRVIVNGPDGSVAGAASLPIVVAPTGTVNDVTGPAIHLAFADDRYRVCPGASLEAAIADTSGVNILGTEPSNSVLYELDGTGFLTNVSDAFQFDPGSYSSGRVDIALPPGVALGKHELAVYASDVLGNVGTDTLSFQMIASCGDPEITGTTLFPNPTPGPCRLVCELSQPMQLDWSIYTVAGRLVRHDREEFATAGRKIIPWDGRDTEGDEIANGVYLYVLRGSWTGNGGHDITQTGRIVIMK
jgi:hypothetical protein